MRHSRGQILLEVLIGAAVIIFVSIGIASTVAISLRGIQSTTARTSGSFLSQESVEAMRAIAKEDWHNVTNLATSSANHYYATTSAGKWVSASSNESVSLNSITYTRYFWLDDVNRSTSTGNIVSSGGYWDPSTKKMTTKITWTTLQGVSDEFSQALYLSRFLNETYGQTDWSGGAVGEVVVTAATTTFATSTSIDYASTTGSIKLQQQ